MNDEDYIKQVRLVPHKMPPLPVKLKKLNLTDRPTDGPTDRPADRPTDRQTDQPTDPLIELLKICTHALLQLSLPHSVTNINFSDFEKNF